MSLRKWASLCLVFVIFFTFQIGSALAAEGQSKTKLEETINKLIGISYKWGGETVKGFDCSGLTMYVYKQFGNTLPHWSKGQSTLGVKVAKVDLRAGDLVSFNTNGSGISHVGIYLGDGEFVHASNKGVNISKLSDTYYARRYVTSVRIFNDQEYHKLIEINES